MKNIKDRLYEIEKPEWEKIENFLNENEKINPSINKVNKLKPFKSIKINEPIIINNTWIYIEEQITCRIFCLDYTVKERENIGDGQIGTPSRIINCNYTSFWILIEGIKNLPNIIIEPITPMKKINQMLNKTKINGSFKFNLNYIVKTNNLSKSQKFLSKDIQDLFLDNRKIWFEAANNSILIKDDKSIDFKSFRRKYDFAKSLIEKNKN